MQNKKSDLSLKEAILLAQVLVGILQGNYLNNLFMMVCTINFLQLLIHQLPKEFLHDTHCQFSFYIN